MLTIIRGRTRQSNESKLSPLRPYVVGRVPRSLNSYQAKFEGFLRDNNSSMKIISPSHDGSVKRDITHDESTYWLPTEAFIGVYQPDISYSSCVTPGGNYTLSVYLSHPNKHPRHRKRKYATFLTTHRLYTQSVLTHVWTDPFPGRRCRVLSGASIVG